MNPQGQVNPSHGKRCRPFQGMVVIMRYPEGHKRTVRERIVRSAAEELRRSGLAGIGIPALMKRAGRPMEMMDGLLSPLQRSADNLQESGRLLPWPIKLLPSRPG